MTDVTTTQQNGVLSADDLDLMKTLGEQHKTEFKKDELAMPWLTIVQGLSPYVDRDSPLFIHGAAIGDITDTVSLRLRQKVAFIPVHQEVNYTEWKPNRGPMVKQYFKDDTRYKQSTSPDGYDFGPRVTDNGNDIVPSSVWFGIAVDEDGGKIECILSMTGTQAKKSRRLATYIDMFELDDGQGNKFKPPMYAKFYGLSTVSESNDSGKWAGWKITPGPMVMSAPNGKALFLQARDFRQRIEDGKVRAVVPPAAANAEQAAAQAGGGAAGGDDDVPFD